MVNHGCQPAWIWNQQTATAGGYSKELSSFPSSQIFWTAIFFSIAYFLSSDIHIFPALYPIKSTLLLEYPKGVNSNHIAMC